MALPPDGDLGSGSPRYMHLHDHTGTTAATPLSPNAAAFMITAQTGNVTITTPVGAEVFAAGDLPTDVLIPVQVMSIQLAAAADNVVLFW